MVFFHSMIKPARVVLFVALLSRLPCAVADIAVIVHPDSALAALDLADVKRLFLGKTHILNGEVSLVPINQAQDRSIRLDFERKILHKSARQIRAYWVERIFTGKGLPPRSAGDDEEIRQLIAKDKGLLGYIDVKMLDATVKAVLIVP